MPGVNGHWDDDEDDHAPLDDRSDLDAISTNCVAEEDIHAGTAEKTVPTLLFTASNPSGSVSATVLINGRVIQVDLSPEVVQMTERVLSDEILLVTSLARLQARAAQHMLITECLTRLGHDRVAVTATLEHEMGLPSPQSVREQRAAAFRARSDVYGY